jgi:hypothetical protein
VRSIECMCVRLRVNAQEENRRIKQEGNDRGERGRGQRHSFPPFIPQGGEREGGIKAYGRGVERGGIRGMRGGG